MFFLAEEKLTLSSLEQEKAANTERKQPFEQDNLSVVTSQQVYAAENSNESYAAEKIMKTDTDLENRLKQVAALPPILLASCITPAVTTELSSVMKATLNSAPRLVFNSAEMQQAFDSWMESAIGVNFQKEIWAEQELDSGSRKEFLAEHDVRDMDPRLMKPTAKDETTQQKVSSPEASSQLLQDGLPNISHDSTPLNLQTDYTEASLLPDTASNAKFISSQVNDRHSGLVKATQPNQTQTDHTEHLNKKGTQTDYNDTLGNKGTQTDDSKHLGKIASYIASLDKKTTQTDQSNHMDKKGSQTEYEYYQSEIGTQTEHQEGSGSSSKADRSEFKEGSKTHREQPVSIQNTLVENESMRTDRWLEGMLHHLAGGRESVISSSSFRDIPAQQPSSANSISLGLKEAQQEPAQSTPDLVANVQLVDRAISPVTSILVRHNTKGQKTSFQQVGASTDDDSFQTHRLQTRRPTSPSQVEPTAKDAFLGTSEFGVIPDLHNLRERLLEAAAQFYNEVTSESLTSGGDDTGKLESSIHNTKLQQPLYNESKNGSTLLSQLFNLKQTSMGMNAKEQPEPTSSHDQSESDMVSEAARDLTEIRRLIENSWQLRSEADVPSKRDLQRWLYLQERIEQLMTLRRAESLSTSTSSNSSLDQSNVRRTKRNMVRDDTEPKFTRKSEHLATVDENRVLSSASHERSSSKQKRSRIAGNKVPTVSGYMHDDDVTSSGQSADDSSSYFSAKRREFAHSVENSESEISKPQESDIKSTFDGSALNHDYEAVQKYKKELRLLKKIMDLTYNHNGNKKMADDSGSDMSSNISHSSLLQDLVEVKRQRENKVTGEQAHTSSAPRQIVKEQQHDLDTSETQSRTLFTAEIDEKQKKNKKLQVMKKKNTSVVLPDTKIKLSRNDLLINSDEKYQKAKGFSDVEDDEKRPVAWFIPATAPTPLLRSVPAKKTTKNISVKSSKATRSTQYNILSFYNGGDSRTLQVKQISCCSFSCSIFR